MRGDSGVTRLTRVRSTTIIAHAAIGRIGRPAFPAPLFEGRQDFRHHPGAVASREGEGVCVLLPALRGPIATKQSTLSLRGTMDCFACARNDDGLRLV